MGVDETDADAEGEEEGQEGHSWMRVDGAGAAEGENDEALGYESDPILRSLRAPGGENSPSTDAALAVAALFSDPSPSHVHGSTIGGDRLKTKTTQRRR